MTHYKTKITETNLEILFRFFGVRLTHSEYSDSARLAALSFPIHCIYGDCVGE